MGCQQHCSLQATDGHDHPGCPPILTSGHLAKNTCATICRGPVERNTRVLFADLTVVCEDSICWEVAPFWLKLCLPATVLAFREFKQGWWWWWWWWWWWRRGWGTWSTRQTHCPLINTVRVLALQNTERHPGRAHCRKQIPHSSPLNEHMHSFSPSETDNNCGGNLTYSFKKKKHKKQDYTAIHN